MASKTRLWSVLMSLNRSAITSTTICSSVSETFALDFFAEALPAASWIKSGLAMVMVRWPKVRV